MNHHTRLKQFLDTRLIGNYGCIGKKGKQYVSLPECQPHCRTPNTQWCNEYLPHGTLANSNYLGKSDHSSFELPPLGGIGNWKSSRKTLTWEVEATSLGLYMWCSCFKSPEVWQLSSRWLALLWSHYLSDIGICIPIRQQVHILAQGSAISGTCWSVRLWCLCVFRCLGRGRVLCSGDFPSRFVTDYVLLWTEWNHRLLIDLCFFGLYAARFYHKVGRQIQG